MKRRKSDIAYCLTVIVVFVILSIMMALAFCITANAADKPGAHEVMVTVDDITAVAEQMAKREADVEMLANLMWNECRGVRATKEKAGVCWTVLNRVDDERWPDTIADVITQDGQFAYTGKPRLRDEDDMVLYDELMNIAKDVVMRWLLESQGIENVGRVLPKEYVFFAGRGGHNWFRTKYIGGRYWNFSLPDPYGVEQGEHDFS